MSEDIYIRSAKAAELTAALWELSDPQPTRGTTGLFPVETEVNGSTCLRVPPDFSILVHKDATLGETIPKILQPWIGDGSLPSDTITRLSGYITSMRGKRLVVYVAFPKLFQLKSMENPTGLGRTREQMLQENRLANPTFL